MNVNKLLKANLTYWSPASEGKFGAVEFGVPALIKGRWEERNERVRKPNGDEIISVATVFVDRPVLPGGYLIEGDFTTAADPYAVGAKEILTTTIVPDMRNVSTERRAYL